METQISASISTTTSSLSHPKVGVGVVVLRHLRERLRPEVLLIRRAKPPSLGMWSFCGGSLELGETLMDCAIREAFEETGLKLRHQKDISPTSSHVFYSDLRHPAVFTAVDVIDRDEATGALRFHYAVVEVAALVDDPRAQPQAGDDADAVLWVDVDELKTLKNLVPKAVEVVEEALQRFHLPVE